MMALFLYVPQFSAATVAAMAAFTILALFLLRLEFAPSGVRTRLLVGVIIAVLISIPLSAQPFLLLCDWEQILESCGGSSACAWTVWLMNACYW